MTTVYINMFSYFLAHPVYVCCNTAFLAVKSNKGYIIIIIILLLRSKNPAPHFAQFCFATNTLQGVNSASWRGRVCK